MTTLTTAPAEERLIDLRFPARADRMALIRPAVRGAAQMCGFDPAATQDIVLAVAEACQNIIRHAYAGSDTGEIVLGLLRYPDGIIVRVIDFAPPVDPDTIRPRDLDDVRPGGLGTHFVREVMDTAEFLRAPDGIGNVLQMTKKARVPA